MKIITELAITRTREIFMLIVLTLDTQNSIRNIHDHHMCVHNVDDIRS